MKRVHHAPNKPPCSCHLPECNSTEAGPHWSTTKNKRRRSTSNWPCPIAIQVAWLLAWLARNRVYADFQFVWGYVAEKIKQTTRSWSANHVQVTFTRASLALRNAISTNETVQAVFQHFTASILPPGHHRAAGFLDKGPLTSCVLTQQKKSFA